MDIIKSGGYKIRSESKCMLGSRVLVGLVPVTRASLTLWPEFDSCLVPRIFSSSFLALHNPILQVSILLGNIERRATFLCSVEACAKIQFASMDLSL